jgi:putative ABC transport system substrate-binding protein
MIEAFRQGLRDAGYSEGRDVLIEWRNARGDYNAMPRLVTELVQRKIEVLVLDGTPATRAAKRAAPTLSIVMTTVSDPVGSGLVSSLVHPGGNITGLTIMTPELTAKRLQLLKETIPGVNKVGVLWNPEMPFHPKMIEELKAAAPVLSIELNLIAARTAQELTPAFSAIARAHDQALYIIPDGLFFDRRAVILNMAAKARLPAIYWEKDFAEEGGFMSYGPSASDLTRRAAGYVDKILKGAKPGDLPIEQPTKFELVVNAKTAHTLGIIIPESVMLRADDVIQ